MGFNSGFKGLIAIG